jgi:AcrR family transcriptional regulator
VTTESGVTARGERTREHLLDVAEQLLSTRGIEGVSLREIRLAAGQRNTSALQFHFGGRKGLLSAIAARHNPRVQGRLIDLYARMTAAGLEDDPRSLVEVLTRPIADYLFEGASARAWVRICADLGARPELQINDYVANASPEALDVGVRLLDKLEMIVPRRIGFDRIMMMGLATLHLCADRARVEGADKSGWKHMSQDDFIENVVDMANSALFAPFSRQQQVNLV